MQAATFVRKNAIQSAAISKCSESLFLRTSLSTSPQLGHRRRDAYGRRIYIAAHGTESLSRYCTPPFVQRQKNRWEQKYYFLAPMTATKAGPAAAH